MCIFCWRNKYRYSRIQEKRFEHIELPLKLLDYFLQSNKSNINQLVLGLFEEDKDGTKRYDGVPFCGGELLGSPLRKPWDRENSPKSDRSHKTIDSFRLVKDTSPHEEGEGVLTPSFPLPRISRNLVGLDNPRISRC